jgi:hypothetical protein
MDLQTTVANAVSIIGGSATLGAFFDQVLITKATRVRIKEFIKKSDQPKRWQDTFFNYISLINASVFNRFFSAPFLSLSYFCSCAIVSIFFLAVVVILQISIFGSGAIADLSFTQTQLIVFGICIAINLVIDWISIGQTQVFFAISGEQKTASRAILLIVSDFILTVNFFTMIYAQPVAYLIASSALWRTEVKLQSTATTRKVKPSEDDTDTPYLKVFGKDQEFDRTTFFFEVIKPDEDTSSVGNIVIRSNTEEYSLKDVFELGRRPIRIATKERDRYFLLTDEDEKKEPEKRMYSHRGSTDWKALNDLDNSEEFQEIEITFPFFSDKTSLMYAYTIAYSNIDTMQDGFPSSVLISPYFLSIKDLLTSYFREIEKLRTDIADDVIACGNRVGGKLEWRVELEPKDCEGKMIFSSRSLRNLLDQAKIQGDVFRDAQVPLNSLFLTSLSATALLYVAAFFLLLSRQLVQKLIGGVSSVERYFLRSPFAWVGLITGLFVFVVSCIF